MAGYRQIPTGKSDNVQAVFYNDGLQKLLVQFLRGGAQYVYESVPVPVAEGFANSGSGALVSPGKYFRENVLGRFNYSRLS